jgi:hypothetical protein
MVREGGEDTPPPASAPQGVGWGVGGWLQGPGIIAWMGRRWIKWIDRFFFFGGGGISKRVDDRYIHVASKQVAYTLHTKTSQQFQ